MMSSIGPQLPPQISKRKRAPEDGQDVASPPKKHPRSESPKNRAKIDLGSDDDYGPSVQTASKRSTEPSISPRSSVISKTSTDLSLPSSGGADFKAIVGPSLPIGNNGDEIDLSDSDSDTGPAPPQPKHSTGPAPPPSTRPDPESSDSDADSDDDYGPALPGASAARPSIGPQLPPTEPVPQRDTWMLAPPSASSYTERDPTRMRNRKFASKPSTGPSTVSSIWTETPEEKLKRLQDSVLGRGTSAQESAPESTKSKDEVERQRRIAASIEAQRGQSLFAEHQQRRDKAKDKVEEEDDPSKRGFDREKDMALGGKIGTAQRRELMNKAANFGGRFQKGSFL